MIARTPWKRLSLGLAALVVTAGLTAAAFGPVASALIDSKYPIAEKNLGDRVRSYVYVNALSHCIKTKSRNLSGGINGNLISESNAQSGNWFTDKTDAASSVVIGIATLGVGFMVGAADDEGAAQCNDVVKEATNLWGYSNSLELLCTFVDKRGNGSSCMSGNGGFGDTAILGGTYYPFEPDDYSILQGAIRNKLYRANGDPNSFDFVSFEDAIEGHAGWYLLYQAAFNGGCSPVASTNPPADFAYTVTVVNPGSGQPTEQTYEGLARSTERFTHVNNSYDQVKLSCATIADRMNAYADGYESYVLALRQATGDGDKSETNTEVCTGEDCGTESASSCVVEGVGWLVCPITNFLANMTDWAYSYLAENLLQTDAALLNTDPNATNSAGERIGTGTLDAWSAMRNVANVLFVIAFLVIIYSQLTSAGVTNYGVKKLLPRIVVAAILVNLSFFVCQILVDLSNILGASLNNFFGGIANGITLPDSLDSSSSVNAGGFKLVDIAVLVLAGGVAVYLALPILGTVLLGGLMAVLMIVAILLARKALIVLLVVLAPVAFVAYLLPNTEQWYKKWQKMFIGLLMVYPIVGLVFGASNLASAVLRSSAGDDTMLQIMAAGVAILPLFVVPSILKGALNSVNGVGNIASKLSGKATGWGRKRGGEGQQRALGKFANSKFGTRVGQTRGIRRLGARATGAGGGQRGRLALASMGSKAENEETQSIMDGWSRDGTLYDGDRLLGTLGAEFDKDGNLTNIDAKKAKTTEGQAAMRRLAEMGDTNRLVGIRSKLEGDEKAMTAYNRATASQFSALKSKDFRAVFGGKQLESRYKGARAADMHTMTDDALDAGAAANGNFAATLRAAVADPEQQRYFSRAIRAKYGGGQAAAPSSLSPARTAATAARQAASASPGTPPPVAAGGGNGGGVAPPVSEQLQAAANAVRADNSIMANYMGQTQLTRDQVEAMGADHVASFVEKQGGFEEMSDGNLIRIANAHGGTDVGQQAKQHLVDRGVLKSSSRRDS